MTEADRTQLMSAATRAIENLTKKLDAAERRAEALETELTKARGIEDAIAKALTPSNPNRTAEVTKGRKAPVNQVPTDVHLADRKEPVEKQAAKLLAEGDMSTRIRIRKAIRDGQKARGEP
jgi:hypothetical protein